MTVGYEPVNFQKFLEENPELEMPIAKFLVLMVIDREQSSWVHRKTGDDNRMSGILLYKLNARIHAMLSQMYLSRQDLVEIRNLFDKTKKAGVTEESLAKMGTFLMRIANQMEADERGGGFAEDLWNLGIEYGGAT